MASTTVAIREYRPGLHLTNREERETIAQFLVDHTVNKESADNLIDDELEYWSLDEIKAAFSKITTTQSDFKPFGPSESSLSQSLGDRVGSSANKGNHPVSKTPQADSRLPQTDDRNPSVNVSPNPTPDEPFWTKAPADLVERSAREGLALCINKHGDFSLRRTGYFCISHVWEEGIQPDTEDNRGVPTRIVKQIFRRISLVAARWIWLDGLAIPSGKLALTFKEEEQKTALINSLADIYGRCEAVLVFDALTMHLCSDDLIDIAIVLLCGKWMTRVWTWQEAMLSKKVLILTAKSTIDLTDLEEALRVRAGVGPGPAYKRDVQNTWADRKFYDLYITIFCLTGNSQRRATLPAIVKSSANRKTGNDIDCARAYFPALGLKWKAGMSREDGMQIIYSSELEHATRLVLMTGSPRAAFLPSWVPSYINGLKGSYLEPIPYDSRGIRRGWTTTKVVAQIPTISPRGLLLDVESSTGQPASCTCEIGRGESARAMKGITEAIKAGKVYLLSDRPLRAVLRVAKSAILVESVELEHSNEAYVHLAVGVTFMTENSISRYTKWLIRHESPTSEDRRCNKRHAEVAIMATIERTHGKHELINAVHSGDEATATALMSDQSEISDRDEKGCTALHVAAHVGNLDMVKILLQHPPRFDPNDLDGFGRTPVLIAVNEGHLDIIRFLIKNGADPHYHHEKIKVSNMDVAIVANDGPVLELLLAEGADPNKLNAKGESPLSWAHKFPDLIRILLSHGADPLGINTNGTNALYKAARNGSVETLVLLLDRGCDPNSNRSTDCLDPLSAAIMYEHEAVVSLLLQHGADPNVITKYDETALMLACQVGNVKICQALVKAGAAINPEKRGPMGETALHYAAGYGHRALYKFLLEQGADPDVEDDDGLNATRFTTWTWKK